MIKKIIKIFTMFLLLMLLFSCSKSFVIYNDVDTEIIDYYKLNKSQIIFPKNQSDKQSLSVIIKNSNGDIIIFDGGREDDADYIHDYVIKNGGVIKAWFLTHIHDDHIGALYKLLSDQNYSNINIENLFYNFADYDWYFDKIGYDAGCIILFNMALSKFKNINVVDKLSKNDVYNFSSVKIKILNDMYKIEHDSINNSSIVYKVDVDNCSMIIFGDLGYVGGNQLIKDIDDNNILKSDILVLSHHGQNGVNLNIYDYVKPNFLIWPTSKSIYENRNELYNTSETKLFFSSIPLDQQVFTFEKTYIFK